MTRSREVLPARMAAVAMARAVLVPLWLCWAVGCAAPPNVVLLLMDDVSAGWDAWGGTWAWRTFHMSHHPMRLVSPSRGLLWAYWAGRRVGQSGCGAGSGTEGTGSSRERLRGEQGPAGQAVSLGG